MVDINNSLNNKKIVGYEQIMANLKQSADCLQNAEKYQSVGVHTPRGILLYGVPGVGKTQMAKSLAGDNVNLIEMRAANCTKENAENYIIETFNTAKNNKPALILIDEIDKIAGTHRGEYYNQRKDNVMKVLLQELDNINDEIGILTIATCNYYEALNPALIRPGRFDRIFNIHTPNKKDREKIFNYYLDKLKLDKDLDIEYLAKTASGCTGAEIESFVNEAAIYALSNNLKEINMQAFQIVMNRFRFKDFEKEVNEKDKHLIAVHEAGHALVALYLKPDNVSGVSIIPQGKTKGHVSMLFNEIRIDVNGDINDAKINIAGAVAELIEFDEVSSGCAEDMRRAVDKVSFILSYNCKYGYEYIANDGHNHENSGSCDKKRAEILQEAHEEVKRLILDHKSVFDKIVKGLEEKNYLSRNELLEFVK